MLLFLNVYVLVYYQYNVPRRPANKCSAKGPYCPFCKIFVCCFVYISFYLEDVFSKQMAF
jgi:hypothetical protein